MQETLQGISVVKAFTLEEQMLARFDANVREVERESNKMARVAARSGPIMQSLAGVAVSLGILYGGYRTIVLGATPGELISFITAFLLATQPAKRVARLNIELNSTLVNVRALFDVLDTPATEPRDDDKPALKIERAGIEYRDVYFAYRTDGQGYGARRPVRRWQIDRAQPAPALLRGRRRRDHRRWAKHHGRVAQNAPAGDRLCRPARLPLPRHDP
jgi:ABC-type multidrug transport system fused ATPase/permease subunit